MVILLLALHPLTPVIVTVMPRCNLKLAILLGMTVIPPSGQRFALASFASNDVRAACIDAMFFFSSMVAEYIDGNWSSDSIFHHGHALTMAEGVVDFYRAEGRKCGTAVVCL
ncbi:uncharacterized protein F5891DRAFT_738446 [Suillus fuscotomentosus]|uniref:Polyketide synthase n=1 Tax=Suillus fuscotomentosus TaxID=1912939 RepID=A0AAD4HFW2_9AGAM|nr:uncharacterized protein F5891DRAFT_738446 [Suillus fuscotomentosus]KAG1894014.1 hypothetical protein F5891DRAFT_738446 [Suillus fuscotomentosus]